MSKSRETRHILGLTLLHKSGQHIKPLFVSTNDQGGAANAALRLYHEFIRKGLKAQFFVGKKWTDKREFKDIRQGMTKLESWWLHKTFKKEIFIFSNARKNGAIYWSSNQRWNSIPLRLNFMDANVINLHWIGAGLIPVQLMKFINKPIVWTMHDSWGYTGGCHVPFECTRFMDGCGHCPQLDSNNREDLSHQVFESKTRHWKDLNFTVVSPSTWLADRFKNSPIFSGKDIRIIPNGLDLSTFIKRDKIAAQKKLSLDPNARYILFAAMDLSDHNKGFDLLLEALHKLSDQDVHLLIIGRNDEDQSFSVSFPSHYLGYIEDQETLNYAFAAASVCVVPSRQENLSNMIMESLASGTGVVAFDTSGNPDLIVHQAHGYLARPYSTEDLAHGIQWVLDNSEQMGINARLYAEQYYDIRKISQMYLDLYAEVANTKAI